MQTKVSTLLNISAVERETGLSKDVLRKWENRYGFPVPLRDALNERAYPSEQVDRLRLIKRLMDTGMRPSKLMVLQSAELNQLAQKQPTASSESTGESAAFANIQQIKQASPEGLRQWLYRTLMQQGITAFVQDTLVPLNHAVGEAWARGELSIHEEHLYSEAVQWLLRDVVANLSNPGSSVPNTAHNPPRILLTTVPEERHGLGLLMVAALFSLEGAQCISLGTQTPVQVIAQAAVAQRVDIVVLSFSKAYPTRRILPALEELRQQLPDDVEIWAGGGGVERLSAPAHTARLMSQMEQSLDALQVWKATRGH